MVRFFDAELVVLSLLRLLFIVMQFGCLSMRVEK